MLPRHVLMMRPRRASSLWRLRAAFPRRPPRTRTAGKQAFAEYKGLAAKAENEADKEWAQEELKRQRGVFLSLLAEHAFINGATPWREAAPKLAEHCRAHKDERWQCLDAEDRERVFQEFVKELQGGGRRVLCVL